MGMWWEWWWCDENNEDEVRVTEYGYILQMSVTTDLLTDERESWDAIASKNLI